MTNLISTQIHSTIGVIRMTRKPVNALGHGLREAISKAHHTFESNPKIAAIVLTGQGRFFSAGADITEFDTARRAPLLTDLIAQIEASKKPVFALVNGIAYGGGFELALGCHGLAILPEAKTSSADWRPRRARNHPERQTHFCRARAETWRCARDRRHSGRGNYSD